MSIGPMGVVGSVAGTQLAQAKGTDADKAAQDTSSQSRAAATSENAEKAAGIGQTEEDSETSERDADGRRLWEAPPTPGEQDEAASSADADELHQSKDPTGQAGTQLDLSG